MAQISGNRDYDYWNSLESWKIQYAFILLTAHEPVFYIDPAEKKDLTARLSECETIDDCIHTIKDFYKEGFDDSFEGREEWPQLILQAAELLRDSIDAGILACDNNKVKREEFISWAISKGLPVPEGLLSLIPDTTLNDQKDILSLITMSVDESGNVLVKHPGKSPVPHTPQNMGFKFKNKKTKEWETFEEILGAQDRCTDLGIRSRGKGAAKAKILMEINTKLNKFFNIENYDFFIKPPDKPPSFRKFTIGPIKEPYTLSYTGDSKDELIDKIKNLQEQRDICVNFSQAELLDKEIRDLIASGVMKGTLSKDEAKDLYQKMLQGQGAGNPYLDNNGKYSKGD
jgi:hypothetical protein